ncbi:FadR/GntR family transcriptional regulator [Streptomyces sp. NPDC001070]
MEPLPRETIVDVLERRLQDDILGGTHAAGSLLPPEHRLAQGYGVTRTTVKHAYGRLTQAGLLETRHGVGTRVRDYLRLGGADLLPMLVRHSSDWLADIFEVRGSVGALIAERAAAAATPPQRARLRALLTAVAGAADPDAVQLADAEVHRALAQATGNRVYVLLTNTLFAAYLPLRARLVAPFRDPAEAAARLEPLVAAVEAGDCAAARAAAQAYLSATQRIMLEALEESGGPSRN